MPATATDAALLRRLWDWELELEGSVAERVEDVGDEITAVLDTRFPLVYDANYLLAESAAVTATKLAAKADEVLGGLGMEHRGAGTRRLEDAQRLSEGLEKLGWEREDAVFMVVRRDPDRAAAMAAEEVELADVEHVNLAAVLAEDWGSEEVAEQMRLRNRHIGEVLHDRWFAARHEGEVASCCRLFQHDGIGQVEDVATLESARNRGLARAAVLAAVRASVEAGNEVTYLSALAGDWPRELYARLGFDAIGEASYARLVPKKS